MTENVQKYIDIAREEILNPKLDITKQYLGVNKIALENGFPQVVRADLDSSEKYVYIYFAIENENYFLVITITKAKESNVYFANTQNWHRVYFTATSEKFSYKELSKQVSFKPITGWSKNDTRNQEGTKYSFSRISYQPTPQGPYSLQELLETILEELEKDTEGVIELSKISKAYVSVHQYQYVSGNAGFSLDINIIRRLEKLNISLEIDTYIVGRELED